MDNFISPWSTILFRTAACALFSDPFLNSLNRKKKTIQNRMGLLRCSAPSYVTASLMCNGPKRTQGHG